MKVLDLETLELKSGYHSSVEEGVSLMEAVAWFNKEPHSNYPQCACPALARFGVGLNYWFDDEHRQKLVPFIPKLVGTRNPALEQARYEYLLNATLNVLIPIALRTLADRIAGADSELADKFREHARPFEELPKIKYSLARDLARDLARARDLALDLALDLPPSDPHKVWDAAIEIFGKAIDLTVEEVQE